MDACRAHDYIAGVLSKQISVAPILEEASMKSTFAAAVMVAALVVSAADVYAMAWGGGRGRSHSSATSASESSGGTAVSVPEPSTLYAAASGLVLLAGAGWYIRRRR
jgi:LPXTG-motif cell wall-anchored protein